MGGVGKRNHYSPPPPRVHTGDPDRVGRHNSRASTFPGTTNLPPVGKQSEAHLPQATPRERGKAWGLLPKLDTQAPQTRVLATRQSKRPGPSRPIKEPLTEGGACQLGVPHEKRRKRWALDGGGRAAMSWGAGRSCAGGRASRFSVSLRRKGECRGLVP